MELEEFINASSFRVSLDGSSWETYEAVSGIGIDIEDIAHQTEKKSIRNRPGRVNARDVTLVRRFKNDRELYDWIKIIKSGKAERKSGSIIMLDDADKEVVRFNFFNAWPKSWSGPTLSKDVSGNDTLTEAVVLSIEDIELA